MKRLPFSYPLAVRLLAVAVLLVAAGVRLHHAADLGAQADEGVHVTAATRVAAGDVLYRDLFENRTPGVIWLLALFFRAGGANIITGRVLATGAALLTIAGLFTAGCLVERSLWRERPSLWGPAAAALLFSLAPLPLFWSRYTMLEHFSAAAAVTSVAAIARAYGDDGGRWWLAAGTVAGMAVVAKQTSLILVAATGATLALWMAFGRGRERSAAVRGGAMWAAGAGAVLGLFVAVLALQGALRPFLHFFSGVGRAAIPDWSGLWSAWWPWLSARPFVPLAFFGAVLLLWKRRLPGVLLIIWAAGEVGALLLAPQLAFTEGGFSHYTPPAMAALALLAGVGLPAVGRLWQGAGSGRLLSVFAVLVVILTLPGWLRDLQGAITEEAYPQPSFAAEARAGRSAALLTEPGEPIVVLGNAIFYHWASRPPASPFFHLPAYLADSPLAEEVTSGLNGALTDPATGAVFLSRLHLDERLPSSVEATLWRKWEPVARFPYAYQRDVFLFQPRGAPSESDPLAVIGDQISLLNVDVRRLSPGIVLVGLTWRSDGATAGPLTAFVHLLGPDGQLLGQHDGVPGVGFRPIETWQSAEQIVDWHWIETGERELSAASQLSIGLYHAASGRRLPVRPADDESEADSYTIPLTITE